MDAPASPSSTLACGERVELRSDCCWIAPKTSCPRDSESCRTYRIHSRHSSCLGLEPFESEWWTLRPTSDNRVSLHTIKYYIVQRWAAMKVAFDTRSWTTFIQLLCEPLQSYTILRLNYMRAKDSTLRIGLIGRFHNSWPNPIHDRASVWSECICFQRDGLGWVEWNKLPVIGAIANCTLRQVELNHYGTEEASVSVWRVGLYLITNHAKGQHATLCILISIQRSLSIHSVT